MRLFLKVSRKIDLLLLDFTKYDNKVLLIVKIILKMHKSY